MNYFNYAMVVGLVSFSVAAVCCAALWLAAPMIVARALGKERQPDADPEGDSRREAAGGRGVIFDFEPAQADALAGLLSGEEPDDIALVVAHLPSDTARSLLNALEPELRAGVIFSLAEPRPVDMEMVRGIKNELENRIYGSIGGVELAAGIIKGRPYAERKTILEAIASRDPVRGSGLRGMFIFEADLAGMGDRDIRAIAGAIAPETMAGFLPALQEKLKGRLKAEYKGKAAKALEKAAPRKALGRKEKEAALDSLMALVGKLSAKGLITRPKPRPEPEVQVQAAVTEPVMEIKPTPPPAPVPAPAPDSGARPAPVPAPAPKAAVKSASEDDDWG